MARRGGASGNGRGSATHTHIVVAGAGIAGIETALALRAFAGDRAAVTVVDSGRMFAIPATATGTAFGIIPSVDVPLSCVVARTRAALRRSHMVAVDSRRRLAMLAGGELLRFENLVIAVGAPPHLPDALTFRGHPDVDELRSLVEDTETDADRQRQEPLLGGAHQLPERLLHPWR